MDDSQYAELLRRTMADLTDKAAHAADLSATLRGVTAACVELIASADCADILVITDSGDYESLAATSELTVILDQAQEEFGEGPCINAAVGNSVVRCDDLTDDPRWPRFGKSAVAAGVHSMLSFQLFTHDHRAGALNIFGLQPDSFGLEDEALGAMLATHCALAFIADSKQHQFQSALASRDIIGQAKGRIMERFNVDAVRAFELLTRLSQVSNTKLADVAAQVVARGSDQEIRL
jgi:transcriptional regulator with GAF, ATPase, and Fis domain